jgi:hypothetical protein
MITAVTGITDKGDIVRYQGVSLLQGRFPKGGRQHSISATRVNEGYSWPGSVSGQGGAHPVLYCFLLFAEALARSCFTLRCTILLMSAKGMG